jgi:hypothetical protein
MLTAVREVLSTLAQLHDKGCGQMLFMAYARNGLKAQAFSRILCSQRMAKSFPTFGQWR